MANSILGLLASGAQHSPIQSYMAGKEVKAKREERASMDKTRKLQQQQLAQAL